MKLVKKGLLYVVPVLMGYYFVFLVFICSMPYNAATPAYKITSVITKLLPEGWSFFTKSPREAMADIYAVDTSLEKMSVSNSEPQNILGFSRRSRKIGMELSLIAAKVPNKNWKPMTRLSVSQLTYVPYDLIYDSTFHFLKPGKYLIVVSSPVPWAWAGQKKMLKRDFKTAYVNLCLKQ